MVEAEKKITEEDSKEETDEDTGEDNEEEMEEKAKTNINIDVGLTEIIKSLSEEVKTLKSSIAEMKKIEEEDTTPPAEVKPAEEEKPAEDETKGVVSNEETPEETSEGFVVERADMGKGFQIYKDMNNLSEDCKFKRLVR